MVDTLLASIFLILRIYMSNGNALIATHVVSAGESSIKDDNKVVQNGTTELVEKLEKSGVQGVEVTPAYLALTQLREWGFELPEGLHLLGSGVYYLDRKLLPLDFYPELGHLAAAQSYSPSLGKYNVDVRIPTPGVSPLWPGRRLIEGITFEKQLRDKEPSDFPPVCTAYTCLTLEKPDFSTTIVVPLCYSSYQGVELDSKYLSNPSFGIWADVRQDYYEYELDRVEVGIRGEVHVQRNNPKDNPTHVFGYDGLYIRADSNSHNAFYFESVPNSPYLPFNFRVRNPGERGMVHNYTRQYLGVKYLHRHLFGFEPQFDLDHLLNGEMFNSRDLKIPISTGGVSVYRPQFSLDESYFVQPINGGKVQIICQKLDPWGRFLSVEEEFCLGQDDAQKFLGILISELSKGGGKNE